MEAISGYTPFMDKENSCLILVDVQEKLTPHVMDDKALIRQCNWLLKLAEELEVPIIISEQYPKGLGNTIDEIRNTVKNVHFTEKVFFSCHQEPGFNNLIKRLNKQQFIICGIETHVCVLQTALDLQYSGFNIFVAADAVSSRYQKDHKYGLKRMQQQGIQLVTSEMIFFEWIKKAGTSEFRSLSRKYLQGGV